MVPSRLATTFIIGLLCASFHTSIGDKKARKTKQNLTLFPKYEMHRTDYLPNDKQISTYLSKGEKKTFLYSSEITNAPLSITIITCTSAVNWIVKFQPSDANQANTTEYQVSSLTTRDIQTLHMTTDKGTYLLEMTSTERGTYVHVYVSTEPGGPQALQNSQTQNVLKLLKRQQRRKLTVRWDPSLVDPQVTDYCLVVSLEQHYLTLCSAHGDIYGVTPPPAENQPIAASQIVTAWNVNQNKGKPKEPLIACVGPKTHFTLTNLRHNQGYYFDLFALNRQSDLTYLYGSSFTIFDKRTKPTRLKDNKSTYVNLKKFDGKAVFRYKAGKLLSDSLKLYVMPCGGAVDIDVSLRGEVVATLRRVEGFGRLVISNPKFGNRYYVKILSSNKEELRRMTGVEVLATTKPSSGTPLPNMPSELSVQEYYSLRKCDSVTVGWLASPGQRTVRYCLLVREGRLRELDSFKMPNQCGLESRLKKSADFTAKYCLDFKQENEQVITQKISQLKAGKSYVVQVTVKKPKGKTLSYDLLQVQTKPTCDSSFIV